MIIIPGKIPVRIHPVFWIIAFLFAWMISKSPDFIMLIWVGIIFVSVLVHEYGHALAALAFGQSSAIDLVGFGGLTTRQGGRLKLWQEFVVVASGPLAGLLLCFCAYRLSGWPLFGKGAYTSYILYAVYSANLFWTLINLLPVLPLDGGNLLSILLQSVFGSRGIKAALFISMCVAALASMYCFLSGYFFFGSFLIMYMFDNYKNWRNYLVYTEEDKKSEWHQLFKEAERDLKSGLRQTAFDKFTWVKNQTKTGALHFAAISHLAEIYVDQGLYSEAFEILNPHLKRWDGPTLFLMQWICYKQENFEQAVQVGKEAFKMKPDYQTALLNAQCNARIGDKKATLGWLKCAIREGLPHINDSLNHKDFDTLRGDPAFRSLYP